MLFHTWVDLGVGYLQGIKRWRIRAISLLALGLGLALPAAAAPAPAPLELKLDAYLRLVLERNEALQAQMLDAEANRRRARGERGVFEPMLSLSATHEDNKRQNNIEQQNQLRTLQFFEENNIYDTGIEGLVPTGAKIRLGYTLSDLNNNLLPLTITTNTPARTRQYQALVGVNITQPLLKNFGPRATMAGIRLAALESDIAFEEYRRQLMLTVSQAEAAYWNLYFAQEQLRFFDESVGVANTIFTDGQERLKAGQASELDVLEAQSGLALRKTKQNDAKQSYFEALSRVRSLYGALPVAGASQLRAADTPRPPSSVFAYSLSLQQVFNTNPDFLIQRRKLEQEKVRLGYARNQRLPELNLKGSYGLNGLGLTPGDAMANLEQQNFPSWSVGMEFKVPLTGGVKARNDYQAADVSLRQAMLMLGHLQTQIANALNTSVHKVQSWQGSIADHQTVVRFNEDLLKTQLERLKVGRVEARKVLEVEADLFDARQSLANALVQYERALLEVQLADGSLLQLRKLEVTREELRQQTLAFLKRDHAPGDSYLPVASGN